MNKNKKLTNVSLPIATKVTIWYTFFIAFILLIVVVASTSITSAVLEDQSAGKLVEKVTDLTNDINKDLNKFEAFDDGIYFILMQDENLVSGAYPHGFNPPNILSTGKVSSIIINGQEFLYFDSISRFEQYSIRGVLPISSIKETIQGLNFIMILASPLLLLIIGFGGYGIIKKSFQPVQKLVETAREIEISKDFSRRLYVGKSKDEIQSMAFVLNNMLSSLEASFIKERQFGNDLSHELRTPVSVILSESEYGVRYVESVEEAKESFEVIHRQSLHMAQLIRSIMELARLDLMDTIEKESLLVSTVLDDLIFDYNKVCESKDILLSYNIEPNLSLNANSIMFQRMVENLFSNAIKFTRDCVDVTLYQENESIILTISDNGKGIDSKHQKFIWQRFFQEDTSRNKSENPGSGLGLSYVNEIVQFHHWKVEVISELGKGSLFKVQMN